MEKQYYSSERNVQILVSVLKANGIKNIVTSPGTTHMCFVGSVIHDNFFKVYSCVDERSAAYMACGLAAESGEAVVITCTGATASRNYYSALTEAYYRKLPIIAVTAHQGTYKLGHLLHQNIDRRNLPYDICKLSVEAVYVKDKDDEKYCNVEINKAILECTRHGGGPVHINTFTRYSKDFSVVELPATRIIKRYFFNKELPVLPNGNVGVFIGAHRRFSDAETRALEVFCESNNAVVLCDHTSGYHGKYCVKLALYLAQVYRKNMPVFDLLIHLGEVSGDNTSFSIRPKQVWRVNEDGEIRDTFGTLTDVFEMPEEYFFDRYKKENVSCVDFYKHCVELRNSVIVDADQLPLSSIWIASQLANSVPENSEVHFGIWSSLRSWNYFETPESVSGSCNVGGFGIDGPLSTLIGASQYDKEKLYFCVLGDLAFYYDMNVLGNRHVGNNIRIIVVNNGAGNEMRYSFSPASSLGSDGEKFLAGTGHYQSFQNNIIKSYAESLGFEYMSASTKEEVLKCKDAILTPEKKDKPMLLEIFMDIDNDDKASTIMNNWCTTDFDVAKNKTKKIIKIIIGKK